MRTLVKLLSLSVLGLPAVSLAASGVSFRALVDNSVSLANSIVIPLIFTFASLSFLWGIYQYFILGGADEEKRTEGRKFALWGIITIVIMLSTWGLVSTFQRTFGL